MTDREGNGETPGGGEGEGGVEMERWPADRPRPEGLGVGDAAVMAALGEARIWSTGTSIGVDEFNAEFAVVQTGGKTLILKENPPDPGGLEPRIDLLRREDFELWTRPNRTVVVGREKKGGGFLGNVVPSSAIWLSSPRRRQYRGIEFAPAAPGQDNGRAGFYNLWRGFAVEPDPAGAAKCSKFLAHIWENVAQDDIRLYDWILGFLAQMVQAPEVRPGVALVLRGKQGVGKSTIGDIMGALFPGNYVLADQGRYVTGQFNAHLADCLLLQADEAFWAGDHDAEGRLKGMVTGRYQMIERKGVDPIKVANFVRLIITSNKSWVVPAGAEERRFCVVDVGEDRIQDREYFGALYREMLEEGGLSGLLHHLMEIDVEAADLNAIPETGALLEQKVRGMSPEESWWFHRLSEGAPTPGVKGWEEVVPKAWLHADYIAYADRLGFRHKLAENSFGSAMVRMLPWTKSVFRTPPMREGDPHPGDRVQCRLLPPLAACRAYFSAQLQAAIDWGDEGGS
ncbi:DUF5906 domain-containing protein [Minwuia thermotolerans]|uniref:NrS-1 polymerase-like helicase domain-containing protein n=1 Tax=Minwuia thermotolerans TaxID=2056226 RepID=A0A2M9G2J5_9PROT|nr:DUF5906 domain-containing protein [Minwuia thermotolerans]PJK29941.1 hypothetical protein CVT23_09235 [Minwuia thermotolerans]